MVTKTQLEAAAKDAADKLHNWNALLDLDAEKVVADKSFVQKYDSAKDAAIKAGEHFRKLYNEFKTQL